MGWGTPPSSPRGSLTAAPDPFGAVFFVPALTTFPENPSRRVEETLARLTAVTGMYREMEMTFWL